MEKGFEQSKKISGVDRVVGKISEEESEDILEREGEFFASQKAYEKYKDKEREKTKEDIEIINAINRVTNELRNKYGLADFDIPAKNIHILPENEWVNIFGEDNGGDGVYSPSGQGILVEDDSEMKIYFAKKLLHEILHAKAYQAIQVIGEENPKLRQYRDGIVIHSRDGEVIYFANFYEALTEELAKKYLKQLLDNPVFKNEVEDSSKIMQESSGTKDDSGEPLFNDETFYVYEGEDEKGPWLRTHEFTYQRPRKILNTLIDKLYEKNEDKFESREEVFELFEKGMITGNILPLGRTIDRTFGKGTFRKIGELDENLDELEEFVDSL